MRVEDCYWFGELSRPHGLDGEVKAHFDVDYIEEYHEMESVYLLTGKKLTPFFIDSIRFLPKNEALIRFRRVTNRDLAEPLSGAQMYLPLDSLPELEEGQFYYHDVPGYRIVDQNLGELGTVNRVLEMPKQDLIVMDYKEVEVLIPITDDIVGKANHELKVIETHLPEGLIEIYLD